MKPKSPGVYLVLFLLPLLVGCVSKSRYEAKEAEVNDLLAQLDNLVTEKKVGARKEERLVNQGASLTHRVDELKDMNLMLIEKNKELTDQLLKLQETNRELGAKLANQDSVLEKAQKASDEDLSKIKKTYEDLLADLRNEIESGNIRITQLRNQLKLDLVSKILFDSGSAKLQAGGEVVLGKVARVLKTVEGRLIQIQGHTDDQPITSGGLSKQFPSNWELSTGRATTVLRYLEKLGVSGEKLSVAGYGPYQPVASNETSEGRARNRRIEILLLPVPEANLKGSQSMSSKRSKEVKKK